MKKNASNSAWQDHEEQLQIIKTNIARLTALGKILRNPNTTEEELEAIYKELLAMEPPEQKMPPHKHWNFSTMSRTEELE